MTERWGYALNQWKPNFDFFTRREQHERALKTASASGFRGIELRAGSGRWQPLGRPEQIAANFGSPAGLVAFLTSCGIDAVASFFFDPGEPNAEEPAPPRSPTSTEDKAGIVASARILAQFLAEVGGDCLVVRAMPSYWREGALGRDALERAAECWNAVGAMTAGLGVGLALHVDFLSLLRSADDIGALLERTDPEQVGLALDTAELTIAGIDPVDVARQHGKRVRHVHLKDARDIDTAGEFATQDAEKYLLLAGGSRRVERWFWELGEGIIDIGGVLRALRDHRYDGWYIVESDESPDPAGSTMLNGWAVQHLFSDPPLQPNGA